MSKFDPQDLLSKHGWTEGITREGVDYVYQKTDRKHLSELMIATNANTQSLESMARIHLELHRLSGCGLGKDEHGIKEAVKVKLKFDQSGDGVTVTSTGDLDISSKKQTTKSVDRSALLYGRFIKSATLTSEGFETKETSASVSDKPSVPGSSGDDSDSDSEGDHDIGTASKLSDEELHRICGGRTAHKGARHGLVLSGKLARIAQQEETFINSNTGTPTSSAPPSPQAPPGHAGSERAGSEHAGSGHAGSAPSGRSPLNSNNKGSDSASPVNLQIRKKSKKNKKDKRNQDSDENPDEPCGDRDEGVGDVLDTTKELKPKKCKKSKKSKKEQRDRELNTSDTEHVVNGDRRSNISDQACEERSNISDQACEGLSNISEQEKLSETNANVPPCKSKKKKRKKEKHNKPEEPLNDSSSNGFIESNVCEDLLDLEARRSNKRKKATKDKKRAKRQKSSPGPDPDVIDSGCEIETREVIMQCTDTLHKPRKIKKVKKDKR